MVATQARPRRRALTAGVAIAAAGVAAVSSVEMASAALVRNNFYRGIPSGATYPECVAVATTKTADGFFGIYTSSTWSDYSPDPYGQPCDNTSLTRNGGSLATFSYKGYNNSVICYSSEAYAENPAGTNRATAQVTNFGGCPTTGNFARGFGQYWNGAAGNPNGNAYSSS